METMSTSVGNPQSPVPPSGQAVVPGVRTGGEDLFAHAGTIGGQALPPQPTTGGGAAAPAGISSEAINQVYTALLTLIATLTAQAAGGGALGGGGMLAGTMGALGGGAGLVPAPSLGVIGGNRATDPSGGVIGGGSAALIGGGISVTPATIAGGGPGISIAPGPSVGAMSISPGVSAPLIQIQAGAQAAPAAVQPGATQPAATVTPAAGVAPGSGTAPAAGAQPAAPAAGGGGEPVGTDFIDRRYLVGTPQAGGIIDILFRMTHGSAPGAVSEGTWMNLQDPGGATLMVHVHGRYAQDPAGIVAALQSGAVVAHTHPDGLIHLHDVR